MSRNLLVESPEGIAPRSVECELRFDALAPLAMREYSFLRREAQISLLPFPVVQNAELLEKFAHEHRSSARYRDVVRCPRVRRDIIFAGPRVAADSLLELENDEVGHSAALQFPTCAQPRDASADDDNWHAAFST